MKVFIKLASYLFHPLWMPLLGSVLYFVISPKFFPNPIVKAKILAITILTVFIPVVFFYLMKNIGMAKSIHLKEVKERRAPLVFFSLIILTVTNFIIKSYEFPELFYFFSGILYSSILGLLLAIFSFKVSLHLIGISGLTMFMISLSIIYNMNQTWVIALLFFAIGWTASSRIQAQAHTNFELILGLLIGFLPQLIMLIGYF